MLTIPCAIRRAAAIGFAAPALLLALGIPASAGSQSCVGGADSVVSDSCMADGPTKDDNGTCAVSGIACRD
jgi:hypothetical protein